MKKGLVVGLVVAVLLVGVFVVREFVADKKQQQAQVVNDPLKFRLKWLVYSSFASHIVALEKGFYSAESLDVQVLPGGPGVDPIRLVGTGEDDIGLAGYEQILMAREKGIPVVAIGEDYVRSGVGFIAPAKSKISEPKDFVGHKVGILPGTDKYTLYVALMAKLGIQRKKIEEIPIGADMGFLFNGTIDVFPGFITNQPLIAEEKGFPVVVIDPYDYGVRPGGNVYFTSENTLKTKRSQLKRFLRATMRGIIVSQAMPDSDVVSLVLKHNSQLNRGAETKIWAATKRILLEKDPRKVGLMYDEKWAYTADISLKYGLIKSPARLNECYTQDLVKEILQEGFPTK